MGLAKPDLQIYIEVLRRLELPSLACVFVDDRPENLTPARELGMKVVLAECSAQVIAEVKAILGMK